MKWYVYCVRCSDGSWYTGATTDVDRRVREHNAGLGGAYTRAKRPVSLVYRETHPDRRSALRREAEIKGLRREEKLRLGRKKLKRAGDALPSPPV